MLNQINQMMARALQCFQSGNHDEAELILIKVIGTQPKNFDALHILGVLKGIKNQHHEALDFFRKALRVNSNDSFLNFNIAKAFSEIGDDEKALKFHSSATRLNPNHPEGWVSYGKSLSNLKRFDESLHLFNKAVTLNPDYAEAWTNQGCAFKELGRFQQALDSFDKSLKINAYIAETWSNRGIALKDLKRLEEAIASYDKAIAIKPDYAVVHFNRGIALLELDRIEEAVASFDKAITIKPDYTEAYSNRGKALLESNRMEEALASYDKVITIKPDYAEAYSNRGVALKELMRVEEAVASYDKAISIKPDYAEAYSNRGIALLELKRVEEAIASYDKANSIKPDFAVAHSNRGIALLELKRVEEAVANFDKAITIKPDYADAYSNRGIALLELKRLEEAVANYDIAISIEPDHPKAHCNKSLAFLLAGKFAQGWELYEWRWEKEDIVKNKRNFLQPLWLGEEDIANKTILLHAEQGLGDTIQFCRYAKLVKERGARVFLEVPKALLELMRGLEGVDVFVEQGKILPAFDFHCPLMSLPLAFQTTIESIPNLIPYIHSNTDKEDKWRVHIGNSGFKIAICWQGSTKGKVDIGRSFPVSLFEGLAKINGVRLISLQKNEGVEQLKNLPAGMRVETLPDDFDNGDSALLDSAAIMKCMDLVITSDTALTHLAGALGVKTWLPLKYVPDWRWMLERSDSPWYPNHRLFRQAKRDKWDSVFNEIELELRTLVLSK